ncbi:YggT family protein [Tahibacter sp. UC22_41]|uniref:YggT family protein n=1 Tax=Tahibacter sp. UC22_41 TaxID=3350178 RepID=UPI0036DDCA12
MGFLRDAGVLLVYLVFGSLMLILLLRLALPLTRARFKNPICQFIYKVTNPVVGPLAQIIPPRRQLSFATLTLLVLVGLVELCLLVLLSGVLPLTASLIVQGTLAGLLYFVLGIAFWSIVLRAIMSFFSPDYANPAVEVVYSLTDPLLQPFRKLPPRSAPFDLSPLYAGVVIRLCMIAVVHLFGPLGTVVLPL